MSVMAPQSYKSSLGYENFTDIARKVMFHANQEAQRFNHEYVGTEHILLGLVKVDTGVAANMLKELNIDFREVRLKVEKIVKHGPDLVTMGRVPNTPRAKKVIEFAIEEARNYNYNYVGTEHLLFGLLREWNGIAYHVLTDVGVDLEKARKIHDLMLANPYTAPTLEVNESDCDGAKQKFLVRVPVQISVNANNFEGILELDAEDSGNFLEAMQKGSIPEFSVAFSTG